MKPKKTVLSTTPSSRAQEGAPSDEDNEFNDIENGDVLSGEYLYEDENYDEDNEIERNVIEMPRSSKKASKPSHMPKKRSSESYMRTEVHDPSIWSTTRGAKHQEFIESTEPRSPIVEPLERDIEQVMTSDQYRSRRKRRTASEEYEHECGYWIVKLFRGKSLSRILKRRLLNYLFFQITIGMILIIIIDQEGELYD